MVLAATFTNAGMSLNLTDYEGFTKCGPDRQSAATFVSLEAIHIETHNRIGIDSSQYGRWTFSRTSSRRAQFKIFKIWSSTNILLNTH